MTVQEKVVSVYFYMWVSRDSSRLSQTFSENVWYVESRGPEYHGLKEIERWSREWNERGTVKEWEIRRWIETGAPYCVSGISVVNMMAKSMRLSEFPGWNSIHLGKYVN
jgi:hypothetical protein